MQIVTRFAPSPTGFLHIGGVRTALFNWLFAKKHQGKFLLRIEDTDKIRSTQSSISAIINGMSWLGLNWDNDVVYQSQRSVRHTEIAEHLVRKGKAYYCYSSKEEIEEFKRQNPGKKFISPWRDRKDTSTDSYVVRLKVAHEGKTEINDKVQGAVTVDNTELDDMVILRADGTPTYMLAVVVDDHDMGVNTIVRGDDHFTNAFRQSMLYAALGWEQPSYAHIPLIHGRDGAKLSKRHGALSVEYYKEQGYLPEALLNYLLRLGWSYKNEEIIALDRAIEIFSLNNVGRSPAKFDLDKLNYLNAHYIMHSNDEVVMNYIRQELGLTDAAIIDKIHKGISLIKPRAKTLVELAQQAKVFIKRYDPVDEKSQKLIENGAIKLIQEFKQLLSQPVDWNLDTIKNTCNKFIKSQGIKKVQVMQSLRAVLLGSFNTPGVFELMEILGKEEVLQRIEEVSKSRY